MAPEASARAGGADLVGAWVRSIRLVQRLGEGGMGEVYLGVDERLQRRVAVKAIRGKRRLDEQAKARFLREARVLSQLEHPNICRLYDLVEADGNDFLVLELVPGASLRELMGHTLGFERKLEIARQVAAALAAAHAMSVAHRDLKPENVMVTPEGVAKVLDFGLARPIADDGEGAPSPAPGERAPDVTATVAAAPESGATLTQHGTVIGTPRYMSPEQARGETVTAASDMYSLGVMLQELFTGCPPYGDTDPASVLQRAMWGDGEPVRGVDSHLAALIERLRALSPRERPTAGETAERLRWIAGKPGRRARRFAAVATAVALAAAAVISTYGFVRARRAMARAEASEARAVRAQGQAEAVNSFLRNMLTSADPGRRGPEVKVLDVLDAAAQTADADFADHPNNRAAVLETLGRTYQAVGELAKGHEMLSRALALRRQELGPRAPETLAAMHNLGRVLGAMDRCDQAESLLRETVELRTAVLGPEADETLETVSALAWTVHSSRRLKEAEALYRRVYDVRRRTLPEDHRAALESQRALGMVLRDEGNFGDAEALLRPCYETAAKAFGPNDLQTIDTLHSLAYLYHRRERYDEAAPLMRSLLAQLRQVRGPEHPSTLQLANQFGRCLAGLGAYGESDPLLRATAATQAKVIGPAHRDTLETMRSLAWSMRKQGRRAESRRIFVERWRIARKHLGEEAPLTFECKSVVANILRDEGDLAAAEPMFRQVIAGRERVLGNAHPSTQQSRRDLAKLLRAAGRSREALALEAQIPPAKAAAAERVK